MAKTSRIIDKLPGNLSAHATLLPAWRPCVDFAAAACICIHLNADMNSLAASKRIFPPVKPGSLAQEPIFNPPAASAFLSFYQTGAYSIILSFFPPHPGCSQHVIVQQVLLLAIYHLPTVRSSQIHTRNTSLPRMPLGSWHCSHEHSGGLAKRAMHQSAMLSIIIGTS